MNELRRILWMAIAGIPFGGLLMTGTDSVGLSDLLREFAFLPIYTGTFFLMLLLSRLPVFRVTGEITWFVSRWGGYLFSAAGIWAILFSTIISGVVGTSALHALCIGLGVSLGYNLARKFDSAWQAKINEWAGN
jgi:hypothetical protein